MQKALYVFSFELLSGEPVMVAGY